MKAKRVIIPAAVMGLGLCVYMAGFLPRKVTIEYGESDIYTQADMDGAVERIEEKFDGFTGCVLHSVEYGGDGAVTTDNLERMNSLGKAKGYDEEFTQVINFKSDFRAPLFGNPVLNPGWDYKDYQWWLARSDGGEWVALTWGY